MNSDFLPHVVAAMVPFAICFAVARAGHVRTAWWLPAGIAVMMLAFWILSTRLGSEVSTAPAAFRSVLLLGLPAILGGAAGILLGRRRT